MAVPPLRALVAAGHDVVLVVTRADRRRGRGGAHVAEPGQGGRARARHSGDPRHRRPARPSTPTSASSSPSAGSSSRTCSPRCPMVNVHFSLLPRWRGAAPVERALLAGDAGDRRVHHGASRRASTPAACTPAGRCRSARRRRPTSCAASWSTSARRCSSTSWPPPCPSPSRSPARSRTPTKISPDELRLDWDRAGRRAGPLVRLGGAWTTFRGRRLKVHDAVPARRPRRNRRSWPLDGASVGTGDGSLRLVTVQPGGKGLMSWADFANGARPHPGETFGDR